MMSMKKCVICEKDKVFRPVLRICENCMLKRVFDPRLEKEFDIEKLENLITPKSPILKLIFSKK